MKILVFGHWLEVGGTQVNAIDLATALRDIHGHEVVYFATPGPMLRLIEERGLRFLPAPPATIHPSPARMRALRDALRRERPDVVHVWDWWQCLDAYYVAPLLMRVPMVLTDMSMNVARVLPKALPTTFGTPELAEQAKAAGRRPVEVLLPPVDVRENAPDAVDPGPFRERHRVRAEDITLVSVSRLSAWMKGEALRRAIASVRALGREHPLRLLVVGDGEARDELQGLASAANQELGREAVVLVGAMLDPRPAYGAADVVVGMGGSALRGMAFAKPLLVVGERGFAAPFDPTTADDFHHRGFYGVGDGDPDNARLTAVLRGLAEHREAFPALGEFSRRFVQQHFALEVVAEKLERFLREAAAGPAPLGVALADGLRTAAVWVRERRFLPSDWNARMKAFLSGRSKGAFA